MSTSANIGQGTRMTRTTCPPPTTRDLSRDSVASHVKDKAGFFDAVARLSKGDSPSPLGDLEKVVVKGDTATGCECRPSFETGGVATGCPQT